MFYSLCNFLFEILFLLVHFFETFYYDNQGFFITFFIINIEEFIHFFFCSKILLRNILLLNACDKDFLLLNLVFKLL